MGVNSGREELTAEVWTWHGIVIADGRIVIVDSGSVGFDGGSVGVDSKCWS